MEEALQYSQLITNIIIILLFIGLVILVFILNSSIKKAVARIEKASLDMKDLKPKVETTIDKIASLSDNVNLLVEKVNENVEVLSGSVNKVKDTIDDIIEFEQKVQKRIEPPVMETVNTIAAVTVGVKTFFEKMKERKKLSIEMKSMELANDEIIDAEDETKELEEVNEKLSNLQK